MHKKEPSANGNNLSATVEECLPALEALTLSLQIYGNEHDGAKLRSVIDQLRSASPDTRPAVKVSLDFVVNGTFKVSRQQVANTLWYAFTGAIPWVRVIDKVVPRELRFRSIDQTNPGIVDYPLNEGGAIRMLSAGPSEELLELHLDKIAGGLETLANYYPRHFADLVNENSDSVTADALLQCCLFGEIVYG